jgi:hypothetical protein
VETLSNLSPRVLETLSTVTGKYEIKESDRWRRYTIRKGELGLLETEKVDPETTAEPLLHLIIIYGGGRLVI